MPKHLLNSQGRPDQKDSINANENGLSQPSLLSDVSAPPYTIGNSGHVRKTASIENCEIYFF